MFRTLKSSDWFSADGFPIAVLRREPQEAFPLHNHDFAEVVLVTKGRGQHAVGRQALPLSAGDVFVIGGSQAHAYRNLESLHLINILFQPERLRLQLGDLAQLPGYHALFALEPAWRRRHQFKSRLHLAPRDLGRGLELVDQLDAELQRRAPGFGCLATAWFLQIVGFLSRCYDNAQSADSRHLLHIAQAISHLETHASDAINLDQLAGIARMSRRSLVRAFREATGLPPIAYLIQLRLNRAAALLRSGTESITDVAFQVGFTDSNYFTRQFRQVIGVSPRRYQRQHAPGRR